MSIDDGEVVRVLATPEEAIREHDIKRFWRQVHKSDLSSCWVWAGKSVTHWGYGRHYLRALNWRVILAHRFSWELHVGPIPHGLKVLHKCDNPPCVNPDHLFLGTDKDNSADCIAKGRYKATPKGVFLGSRPEPKPGSLNPFSKLTEAQAVEIKRRAAPGSFGELAREFGVSRDTISAIYSGKRWPHLRAVAEAVLACRKEGGG